MNNDKNVIVTGATGGIGKSIIKNLLEKGYNVIATDIDEVKLKTLKKNYFNSALEVFAMDLNYDDSINEFFNHISNKYDSLYALINNAGVYYGKPLSKFSKKEVSNSFNVNILAPMMLSEKFGSYLKNKKQPGNIINIGSVAGEVGSQEAPYGAFKAAIFGLTKSNAMNFSPYVRVNCISPAAVRETQIWNSIPTYRLDEYVRQEVLNDPINPQGIANAVLFFIGDESINITGKILSIDNGCYPR